MTLACGVSLTPAVLPVHRGTVVWALCTRAVTAEQWGDGRTGVRLRHMLYLITADSHNWVYRAAGLSQQVSVFPLNIQFLQRCAYRHPKRD